MEEAGFLGSPGVENRNHQESPESPLLRSLSPRMPPCDGFGARNVTGRPVPRVEFRDKSGDSGLPEPELPQKLIKVCKSEQKW